jgi:ADP-ribose pyrophosphatase
VLYIPRVKFERLEIESDELVGEGGFLKIRRLRMRNRRDDGSLSDQYNCDFMVRPMGVDAVVVAIYARVDGDVKVLVRDGLRPALAYGRHPDEVPVPDGKEYLFLTELVAGIVEGHDRGLEGIRRRSAEEAMEEAGFAVSPDDIVQLGSPMFPSPGAMAEKYWLVAVEVDPATQQSQEGDGSPMEEGATTKWLGLDEAIAACVSGEIEDAKTELGLRRLRDRLNAGTGA